MNLFLISSLKERKTAALECILQTLSPILMVLVLFIVHQDLVKMITKCVFNTKSLPLIILLFLSIKMESLLNRFQLMKENT